MRTRTATKRVSLNACPRLDWAVLNFHNMTLAWSIDQNDFVPYQNSLVRSSPSVRILSEAIAGRTARDQYFGNSPM